MNEWDSLQRESIRIRMALVGLIQDMEKWSNNDYEQRYSLICWQWQIVDSMLLQIIKKGHVRDIGESIEMSNNMREEIHRLTKRYSQLSIKKDNGKEEPLLMDQR